MKKEVVVFVDGTDWRWEVGHAADGNRIYPDLDCLKAYNKCWEECGVVKCRIEFLEEVVPENWELTKQNAVKGEFPETRDEKYAYEMNHRHKHLEYLEDLVEKQKIKIENLKNKFEKGE